MLKVTIFHSFEAVAPLRQQLAELNRASRQPSPFSRLEFYESYVRHDEFLQWGREAQVWFLVAADEGRVVGYLALRRVEKRLLGLRVAKLEFLATHDVERPQVVCRPEDEARCADAFYRAVLSRRSEWSMFELRQQDAGSPFLPKLGVPADGRHFVRPFEDLTVNVIANKYRDLAGYLGALDKKFRANVRRQVRLLVAAGEVRFLYSTDPAATSHMLELYLDIERRSWKARVGGTVGRDPRRMAFFRELLHRAQPFRLGVGLLLLDGLPIAGCISNRYEKVLYLPQIVFDDAFARLSPGSLLFSLMMREAIDGGCQCLNLMSGFSYYKAHWLAQPVECTSVQVFRIGSALFYKAILGDLRRTLAARLNGAAEKACRNEVKHSLDDADEDEPPIEIDRRFIEVRLAQLASAQVRVTGEAELAALFSLGGPAPAARPAKTRSAS